MVEVENIGDKENEGVTPTSDSKDLEENLVPVINNNNNPVEEKLELTPPNLKFTYKTQCKTILKGENKNLLIMNSIDSPLYEPEKRSGLDLVIVVDISGSMGPNMELMKGTLEFLITQLHAIDTISLVTFETSVEIPFPSLQMTLENKQVAISAIRQLKSKDSTNLSGGLLTGIEQVNKLQRDSLEKGADEKRIQSILLFTDGYANVGITDTAQLIAAITPLISDLPDCSLFTFGFGKSHSDKLLREIAETTKNGMYYFVQNRDQIPEMFVNCLGGLLSVLAQLVKLTIQPLNSSRIVELLSDYKYVIGENGSWTLNMNDVFSEEHRDILFKIESPSGSEDRDLTVVQITLSYFNVASNQFNTFNETISLQVVSEVDPSDVNDIDIDAHYNQIVTTRAMEEAKSLADKGDFVKAQQILADAKAHISSSVSRDFNSSVEMLRNLEESIGDMKNRQVYDDIGSKKMAYMSKMISKQKGSSALSKKMEMMMEYEQRRIAEKQKKISSGLVKGEEGVLEFTIGNRHELLPLDQATPSKIDPTRMCTHRWTVFVTCSDPDVIDRVQFTLHPTFGEDIQEVNAAPFELTRNGWGVFALPINVYFKQDPIINPNGILSHNFLHVINFQGDLTQESHLFRIRDAISITPVV